MSAFTIAITPQALVSDLLRQHPQTRAVFDRYGLHGCGGAGGPVESLGLFARTHGVELDSLLAELQAAVARPPRFNLTVLADRPSVADSLYRPFFTAGILAVLTVGAAWGVWLLWQIGLGGSFTGAASLHEINAHGHAQIHGWVGLFLMGFAYQAFPRLWHTRLAAVPLALAVFAAMLVGLLLRVAGMAATGAAWALPAAMAGGTLEVLAVLAFVTQVIGTFFRSQARFTPYTAFLFVGLFFLAVQAAAGLWHTWHTMTAVDSDALVAFVATYQAPLRDLQIHGMALFTILGVSLHLMPGIFGLPRVRPLRAFLSLGLLLAGVVGEVSLFLAYRWTGSHAFAAGLMLPWLALAVGATALVWPWRLWRPLPQPEGYVERSGKFIRAAYGWLGVSLAMLLLLPVYQVVSGIEFSHAYYGAIRHAITVGFVSMMIMAVAAKVVPTLGGVDPRRLPALWGPFVLVNVGCFLRVSLQVLTDWHPSAFATVGVSGVLEIAALAWWGLHLLGLMGVMRLRRRPVAAMQPAAG